MTACFTGHRPNKLGGYRPNPLGNTVRDLLYQAIEKALSAGYNSFISGGALGIDQWALEILLEKRAQIQKIIVARPFPSQACRWPADSVRHYMNLLSQSDEIIDVCDDPYEPWKMQKRNEWMVDHSDLVIAVWDGSKGGTANCVTYAKSKQTSIWHINIKNLVKNSV